MRYLKKTPDSQVLSNGWTYVGRLRQLRSFLEDMSEDIVGYLRAHPEELSFATALEAELGVDLTGLA